MSPTPDISWDISVIDAWNLTSAPHSTVRVEMADRCRKAFDLTEILIPATEPGGDQCQCHCDHPVLASGHTSISNVITFICDCKCHLLVAMGDERLMSRAGTLSVDCLSRDGSKDMMIRELNITVPEIRALSCPCQCDAATSRCPCDCADATTFGIATSTGASDAPPDVAPRAESPVTWHVIIWLLLTLCINSISQPAGHVSGSSMPRSYRLYLASSPVIVLTDALLTIGEILAVCIGIGIPLAKATRYVVYEKYRIAKGERDDMAYWPERASWPRSILFIIGTAPALIKLASFSGIPWTKAWGLMFGISYLILESITMICAYGTTVPPFFQHSALGYSVNDWRLANKDELRAKIMRHGRYFVLVRTRAFVLAILIQLGLTFWTLCDLRGVPTVFKKELSLIAALCIDVATATIFCASFIHGLDNLFRRRWVAGVVILWGFQVTASPRDTIVPSWVERGTTVVSLLFASAAAACITHTILMRLFQTCPRIGEIFLVVMSPPPGLISSGEEVTAAGITLSHRTTVQEFIDVYALYFPNGFEASGKDSGSDVQPDAEPVQHSDGDGDGNGGSDGNADDEGDGSSSHSIDITEAVLWPLASRESSDSIAETKDQSSASKPTSQSHESQDNDAIELVVLKDGQEPVLTPAQPTSSIESTNEAETSTQDKDGQRPEIDPRGVACLIFFCFHIILTVMWYAILYDPAGTHNPDWTDVFG